MCGRHRHSDEAATKPRPTLEGAYEGETVRLTTHPRIQSTQSKRFHHGGGFPWWTLWLIWPLFGVIKGVFGALGEAVTALFAALPTIDVSVPAVWPVALIVIGLLVLRRR